MTVFLYNPAKKQNVVDKTGVIWLNDSTICKDIDGKLAFFGSSREPAVGASRCGRFWRSDSRVDLVNATVSNEIRFPPLQG